MPSYSDLTGAQVIPAAAQVAASPTMATAGQSPPPVPPAQGTLGAITNVLHPSSPIFYLLLTVGLAFFVGHRSRLL